MNQAIKTSNRSRIFNLFLEKGLLSRRDVQMSLDLSLPTITQNLGHLLDEGLICESGSIANTGGRNATTYALVKAARVAIGVDITNHYIIVVLVDLAGKIVAKSKAKVLFDRSDSYYQKLADMIEKILRENSIADELVLGVGIGLPGLTDGNNHKIVYGKILDFDGVTSDEFGKYIQFPVTIHNDANAACFAELFSEKDGVNNGFYIMLSTNVGGAVFINGSVYIGDALRSGEVGHLIIHPEGRRCYCGCQGCLDPYCSAINLTSISDGDIDIFFQMLDLGNADAHDRWEAFLGDLALAIKDVRMLFNCNIILGGFIGAKMGKHLDTLKRMMSAYSTFDNNFDYIVICKYQDEAIASGAALSHIVPFIQQYSAYTHPYGAFKQQGMV